MEECREQVKNEALPNGARTLIREIQEHHRDNKVQKLQSNWDESREIKEAMREKYADLIEVVRELKPQFATHFRLSRSGDVVFIANNQNYGQTFKRLWSLHLPLC
mgnify:FL=1